MAQLVPMVESEFQMYCKSSVENYAQEHIRVGDWHPSDALQRAEKEFQRLLPDGIASKNHYFFSIQDDHTGEKVGMIWFAVRSEALRPLAFIYDFLIYPEFRRRGYGEQAFIQLEEKAKELGLEKISLQVLGHNQAAIALYQKAGYEITNLQMEKKLSV